MSRSEKGSKFKVVLVTSLITAAILVVLDIYVVQDEIRRQGSFSIAARDLIVAANIIFGIPMFAVCRVIVVRLLGKKGIRERSR